MKRKLMCGLMAMAVTASLAPAAEEQVYAEEVKTLEFFWFTDGDEDLAMRKVLDDFEELHPNIKVELVEVAYSDLNEKIMMAVAGGEAPALARVTVPMQFYEVALDLTETLGGEEAFFADYADSFRINQQISMDGKIYTIPGEQGVTGIFYNKTAFEEAGVEVPSSIEENWSWEEFTEALQTVVDHSSVQYGLVYDYTSQRWSNLLYQFGGQLLKEDGTAGFTSEQTLSALTFTKDSFDSGLWEKSVWLGGEDASNLFASGQVAAHVSGTWNINAYSTIEDFEVGVTYLPYQEEQAAICATKYFIGFEGTGVEEETKELLAYLTTDAARSFYEDSLYLSPDKDHQNLTYDVDENIQSWFDAFSEQMTKDCSQAIIDEGDASWSAVNTRLREDLGLLVADSITPEEVMADIDQTITDNQ
ncbi:MAG: sugar ABC transporter substrate-binding protein [Eubacteriales bacterium]|nr:sugar ABC transporter substrate-binding protein [Eubacteriales bacterium]